MIEILTLEAMSNRGLITGGKREMGEIKQKYDDTKIFLSNLTEREFYNRLNFNRKNGHNRGQK